MSNIIQAILQGNSIKEEMSIGKNKKIALIEELLIVSSLKKS